MENPGHGTSQEGDNNPLRLRRYQTLKPKRATANLSPCHHASTPLASALNASRGIP